MSKISQYTEAQSVDLQNVLPIVTGSVTKETKKVTVETLGKAIAKEQVYVELETESKNVIGAINELNEGGGGGGGHTILDNDGTSLTQRAELQFKGAYSEDNSTDEVTEVNVIRSMTKAEFDLLSNDEKVGIINVTDVTGGGENEFQPVIYSTTEREIGVWTDGKPLYEKTLVTNTPTALTNNAWAVIPWENEPANIETLVNAQMTEVCPNLWYAVRFSLENGHICGASASNANFPEISVDTYVIIQYTKSTDQAGSGTWTPQGVPAVHYSTSEQVVGTWIDGSTVYEKTIVGDDTYNQQFNYIPHGVTNLDKIIDYFGYCYYGGTDFSIIPYLRGNTYITVTVWDSTNIRVERTGLSSSFTGVRLVIRYTKTGT